jgi:glucosamine-6-phosphate deaminase
MNIKILQNPVELGQSAGQSAAVLIKESIAQKGVANVILATGTSQFETLKQLVSEKDIDWGKVTMFHLDEYIGLPESHPASFRGYLKERFLEKVSPLQASYLIDGENDPLVECERLNNIIKIYPIDVALVGIGENGHLAFNDPPADFETERPYIIANLDKECRKQQYNEGWFKSVEDVPKQAISMSIMHLCKSKYIICCAPDSRKAEAVKECIDGPVNNLHPASILQHHPNCTYFLDKASAVFLSTERV